MEEAERNGAPLPVTQIVSGYYAELSANGHGRNDTSSLIRRLTKARARGRSFHEDAYKWRGT